MLYKQLFCWPERYHFFPGASFSLNAYMFCFKLKQEFYIRALMILGIWPMNPLKR